MVGVEVAMVAMEVAMKVDWVLSEVLLTCRPLK